MMFCQNIAIYSKNGQLYFIVTLKVASLFSHENIFKLKKVNWNVYYTCVKKPVSSWVVWTVVQPV